MTRLYQDDVDDPENVAIPLTRILASKKMTDICENVDKLR